MAYMGTTVIYGRGRAIVTVLNLAGQTCDLEIAPIAVWVNDRAEG
jgi:hypothetical protein